MCGRYDFVFLFLVFFLVYIIHMYITSYVVNVYNDTSYFFRVGIKHGTYIPHYGSELGIGMITGMGSGTEGGDGVLIWSASTYGGGSDSAGKGMVPGGRC